MLKWWIVSKLIYPVKKNNRFCSELTVEPESLIFGTIPSFIKSLWHRSKRGPARVEDWHDPIMPLKSSIDPIITWIGHSTFLIQVGGINIMTDPIFGNASFLYPRLLPPGIHQRDLPEIDYILLSHNHRDHMDSASLMYLNSVYPSAKILVPDGDKEWFTKRDVHAVTECTWWQWYRFNSQLFDAIKFTFVPAAHWSQRGLFDKNKSLWGGWMIECGPHTIYFAGDTAYAHHFKMIGEVFKNIDIAILPIAPCEPREWMKRTHIDPIQAGQAFLDLKARHFVPMHWGTFSLGTDYFELPIELLKQWWQKNKRQLADCYLHIVKAGQPMSEWAKEQEIIPVQSDIATR